MKTKSQAIFRAILKKNDESLPIDTPDQRKRQHLQNSQALAMSPQKPESHVQMFQDFVKRVVSKLIEKEAYNASSKEARNKNPKDHKT